MLTTREVILFKVETTAGQDPGLTAADNAILVENPSWTYEGARMIERPVTKPALGKKRKIFGGTLQKVTFSCEVKGSGTAGTAPEIGPLLRVCGMGETTVASTSVTYAPASTALVTGTLYYYRDGMLQKLHGCIGTAKLMMEAGAKMMLDFEITGHAMSYGTAQSGTATTVVIASTASATDDTYNGQTINIISGTGAGGTATITDYTGSTKTVTVASWSAGTPDSTSVYEIVGGPIDASLVSPTYDSTVPVALKGVPASIGSYSAIINKMELDFASTVATPPNMASPDGYGTLQITGREPKGSFDPQATLVATKAWENIWKAGTTQAIDTGTIGTTAGNKVRLQVPYAYTDSIAPGDQDGIRTYDIAYAAAESAGDDEWSIAFT